MPGVAVVVPNFNGEDVLGACLDAVEAQTVTPAEILVADNGSTDGSLELLAARGVRTLALEHNHGFAGGANRGVAATRAPLVAVLNSDARPAPDWLERLLEHTGRDDVWAFGAVLVRPGGDRIESAGDLWSDEGFAYKLARDRPVTDLPAEPYEVFAAPGAAPLFRRDRFEALGGYEERFFLYYEDIDLAYRALLRGWRALVVPAARVEHLLGASGTRGRVRFHVARNSLWTAVRCVPEPSARAIAARAGNELRWNRPRRLLPHELAGRAAGLAGLPRALRDRRQVQGTRALPPDAVRERLAAPAWAQEAA